VQNTAPGTDRGQLIARSDAARLARHDEIGSRNNAQGKDET
jgi:hypothetical protein